ncbi:MAG: glycosyltransferase family 2 protein [Candidatus Methanofastidiosa archaeon]|nr:glycosyltransferase family 2 protein [Candidatus Methanofastidiosa archaeon]
MRVSVVIPAYNVERTVAEVVGRCDPSYEVVVVDDGSSDDTYEVASETRARVVRHAANKGKGQALVTGLAHAEGDIIVFLDADLQHLPEDIPAIVAPIESGTHDMVIGSRRLGKTGDMPLLRRISNRTTTTLVRLFTGLSVTDTQSGFRAFRADALRAMPLKSKRFEVETEMLVCAARRRLRVCEVPIAIVYHDGPFHFSVLDILRFLRMVLFRRC